MNLIMFKATTGGVREVTADDHDAKIKDEVLAELEQRLKFWDKGVNAIPDYVWHVINSMKENKHE